MKEEKHGKLIAFCTTCKADLKQEVVNEFDELCPEKGKTCAVYPSNNLNESNITTTDYKKVKMSYEDITTVGEMLDKYLDKEFNLEKKDILTGLESNVLNQSTTWIFDIVYGINKSLVEGRNFIRIYFPETFLDNDWFNLVWNFLCNVTKNTTLQILVYTHKEYRDIYNLNFCNEMEVGYNASVMLRTGYEEVEKKSIWKKIINFLGKV